jgi:hypothetical protein
MDNRMVYAIGGKPENKAALDAIVKDYSDHPALFGYHIVDEPAAGSFAGLAEVVAYLKEKDPKHPGYINLLPTYGRDFNALGTKDFETYVRDYVKTVHPFVISYDHYHFTYHGDREDFFENIETVRKASLAARIPFWGIVLAIQHFDYRNLTEAELRWEAMQTLAFGARGLLWFTYWSPQDPDDKTPREKRSVIWEHAIIDEHGKKDAHYDMIKRVNAELLALGNELIKCTSTEVFQTGKPVTTRPSIAKFSPATKPSARSPIQMLDNSNVTVGVFQSPDGRRLALIANRDYKNAIVPRATVKPINRPIEIFDAATKTWLPAPIRERGVVEPQIPAGGAALLRW